MRIWCHATARVYNTYALSVTAAGGRYPQFLSDRHVVAPGESVPILLQKSVALSREH